MVSSTGVAARIRTSFSPGARARLGIDLLEAARTAFTHDRTKTTGRAVIRHGSYLLGGVAVVAKRAKDRHGGDRYERVMDKLEAANDFEKLDDWENKAEHAKERRHQRRMDWLSAPDKLAKAAAKAAAHLAKMDPDLGRVIKATGRVLLVPDVQRTPFYAFLRAIAHQQLSGRAAETIEIRNHELT